MSPPNGYFRIDNHIGTVPAGAPGSRIRVYREPDGRTVRLWGEIAAADKGRTETLAIDDPALFAAEALRDALLRHAISVRGRAVSRHLFPAHAAELARQGRLEQSGYPWVLASWSSMPLVEDLRVTNKVSQNLHAELALRAVARERRGIGSIEASMEELQDFLKESGISEQDFFFRDGSGLSRLDLVSPAAIVNLLAYMWHSQYREEWVGTLPLAGVDGALRGRFLSTGRAAVLRAKTGTLTHVAALSGYIRSALERNIAFSILVNNFNGEAGPIRAVIDRLCREMLHL